MISINAINVFNQQVFHLGGLREGEILLSDIQPDRVSFYFRFIKYHSFSLQKIRIFICQSRHSLIRAIREYIIIDQSLEKQGEELG